MYNDTKLTSKQMSQVLPKIMDKIAASHRDRPDLILVAWPQIIGEKFQAMTRAVSFVDGVLTVIVKNSTLYSLLSQHEKKRLLQSLRKKFPAVVIRDIFFRLG